jgi:hypothetical protein
MAARAISEFVGGEGFARRVDEGRKRKNFDGINGINGMEGQDGTLGPSNGVGGTNAFPKEIWGRMGLGNDVGLA